MAGQGTATIAGMTADELQRLADALHAGAPAAAAWQVVVCASTASTNSDLLDRRDGGSRALFALEQTAGRGRRGREWVAQPGGGLTFSVRVRFDRRADRLAGLSLAVGVMLADALSRLGFDGIGLKWPNDLMRDVGQGAGKLGGVLIELATSAASTDAVIGVGINLVPPPEGRYAQVPVALCATAPAPGRWLQIAAGLLQSLASGLQVFDRDGFAAFADDWNRLNVHRGLPVEVSGELHGYAGLCVGVDVDGALLLDSGDRIERVLAGDVSLRPARPS